MTLIVFPNDPQFLHTHWEFRDSSSSTIPTSEEKLERLPLLTCRQQIRNFSFEAFYTFSFHRNTLTTENITQIR